MKKYILGLMTIVGLFAISAVGSVNAAPSESSDVGPFDGSFNGTVYGDGDSSAAFSLVMTHEGDVVSGTAFIGEGLYVDGGFCGSTYVPATVQAASGMTGENPNELDATTQFDIEGFPVTVTLESTVAGGVIDAEATIDLPWFCGADPVLSATLIQAN